MTFALGGDLPVGRLGFGAMRLTSFRPPVGADRSDAIAVARRAVERGVALIDTADFSGLGANEEPLADALHPYGDDLVIATKVAAVRASPSDWTTIGHVEENVAVRDVRLAPEQMAVLEGAAVL